MAALSLLFCFPVGLLLIWTNTRWSVQAKSVWTALFAAVVAIGFVGVEQEKKKVRATLAEANRLWEGGNRAEAGARYRVVIEKGLDFADKSEHPTIFQRAIEVDVAQGNTSSARSLIDRASRSRIAVASDDTKTNEFIGVVSSERVAPKTYPAPRQVAAPKASTSAKKQFVTPAEAQRKGGRYKIGCTFREVLTQ